MIQRLAANLPDVAYIHQTRNLQSHTSDCRLLTVHRTENHTAPCRKALPPSPPSLSPTVICTTFRFVCVEYILIKSPQLKQIHECKCRGGKKKTIKGILPEIVSTLNAKKKRKKKSFLLICHRGYHGYRHFKAKLQVVDPSEGRGFNFHTLAKKLVLDLTMLRPPAACKEGCVSVWERVCVYVES